MARLRKLLQCGAKNIYGGVCNWPMPQDGTGFDSWEAREMEFWGHSFCVQMIIINDMFKQYQSKAFLMFKNCEEQGSESIIIN